MIKDKTVKRLVESFCKRSLECQYCTCKPQCVVYDKYPRGKRLEAQKDGRTIIEIDPDTGLRIVGKHLVYTCLETRYTTLMKLIDEQGGWAID